MVDRTDLKQWMAGVSYAVESSDFELDCLKKIFLTHKNTWVEEKYSRLIEVGSFDSRPLYIVAQTVQIGEIKVLFWRATGIYVNYLQVYDWFSKMMPSLDRRMIDMNADDLTKAILASDNNDSEIPLAGFVQVPNVVVYDENLNAIAWQMDQFLRSNGAVYGGRVFNNLKPFLKTAIEQWIERHQIEQNAS